MRPKRRIQPRRQRAVRKTIIGTTCKPSSTWRRHIRKWATKTARANAKSAPRFRDALLPFVSGGVTLTDQALRVSAYLADLVVLALAQTVFYAIYVVESGGRRMLFPVFTGFAPAPVGMAFQRLASPFEPSARSESTSGTQEGRTFPSPATNSS